MPPKKKTEEDKISIRRFKDRSSNFWVNNHHYFLDCNNEVQYACGGIDTEEYRTALKDFIKRNKVLFVPREPSTLEQIEKEYTSIITFGKYNGELLSELIYKDRQYCEWLRDKYTFSTSQQKLKDELIEILKR